MLSKLKENFNIIKEFSINLAVDHPRKVFGIGLSTIACGIFFNHYLWRKKMPPMINYTFPFFGDLSLFSNFFLNDFAGFLIEKGKTLNSDVVASYMFGQPFIFILGYDKFYKCMIDKGHETSGRVIQGEIDKELLDIRRGVFSSEGNVWHAHRQLIVRALKDLGLGTTRLYDDVNDEARLLIEELKKLPQDDSTDLLKVFQVSSGSIISQMIFGHRIEDLNMLRDMFDTNAEAAEAYRKFDIKRYIPGIQSDLDKILEKTFRKCVNFIKSEIYIHEANRAEANDLISMILQKQEVQPDLYTIRDIVAIVIDLFRAGTGTTASTLLWAIYHLRNNKNIQEEIRHEIDLTIGGKSLEISDIEKLPKLSAFISETLRFTPIIKEGVPHRALKSFNLDGITIPKGACIMAVQHAILKDPKYWKAPNEFNINNFLNKDRSEYVPHYQHSVEFGMGPRRCPGDKLARIELYIFLIAILQNFYILSLEDASKFKEENAFGFLSDIAVKFVEI